MTKKHEKFPRGQRVNVITCANSESFVRGGPTLTFLFCFVFLIDQGSKDENITKSWPLLARQQNAIKWRFAGGPMMAHH